MSNAEYTTYGPVPAYSNPLPVPSVDPDASITQCVEFNASFLPYILGCLAPLLLPEAWDTDDVSEKLLAIARIDHLRYLLMNPELCTSSSLCLTLAQIMTDAEGNLALFVAGLLAAVLASCGQYLKEQLENIISLDAIMNFFFGASADYAEFASVLPEYGVEIVPLSFRLDGCDFQMSVDDGENWVTQFAFDLEGCAALQGAQGEQGIQGGQGVQGDPGQTGAPGAPGGATINPVTVSDLPKICAGAVAIRDWASTLLSQALSKIDESAAGLAVASAILGETVIGDFILNDVLEMIAGLEVLGTSAINAAHGPTEDVQISCAFYCAIKELGHDVVAQDILDVAAVLAGDSNAWVQSLAALMLTSGGSEFLAAYVSGSTNEDNSCADDCSACSEPWCFDFAFTESGLVAASETQWPPATVLSDPNAHYVWTGAKPMHGTGYTQSRTPVGVMGTFTQTYVTQVIFSGTEDSTSSGDARVYVKETDDSWTAANYSALPQTNFAVNVDRPIKGIALILYSNKGHSLTGLKLTGTGTCPFGSSNC